MTILPTVRPIPYYSANLGAYPGVREGALSRALRDEFVPKLERRLPGHHLVGLPHGFIPAFVAKHKQTFGYFLRTDISKFYPDVRHTDIVVGAQIAYRDLLGLDYVPTSFKKRYVGALQQWTNALPLTRGIPLGSPVSAIAAPLMLIPIWLEIKRQFQVPFLVWCDDLLVLGRDQQQIADIYAHLENRLALDYDLRLNTAKTVSGRFASTKVDYCGWSFAGGYARISDDKTSAYKTRMREVTATYKGGDVHTLIKRINRKVDGFGHYYKHGHVTVQFNTLDVYTRSLVRGWLCRHSSAARHGNIGLTRLGLRSLLAIKERHTIRTTPAKTRLPVNRSLRVASAPLGSSQQVSSLCRSAQAVAPDTLRHEELLKHITTQLTQQTALQRKQLRILKRMMSYF